MAGSLVTPTAPGEDYIPRELEALKATIRELQSSIPKSVKNIVEQITPGFSGWCSNSLFVVNGADWLVYCGRFGCVAHHLSGSV